MNLYDAIKVCPLFMVLTFATGCAERTDYTFAMPLDTSAGDLQSATEAAKEWQACGVLNVTVRVGATEGEDVPLRLVGSIADAPGASGETFKNTWGNPTDCEFTHGKEATRTTIAHEMGHAFGLGHTSSGLMAPTTQDTEHVTPVECRALAIR